MGWAQEFQNPRSGHTSILGYDPSVFQISGKELNIRVRNDESFIQQIVDHTKNYINAANQGYTQQVKENINQANQERRAALEKEIEEKEFKKNVLANVSF